MLNTSTFRHFGFQSLFGCECCIASSTSGECVRYVGLTPPSCGENRRVLCFLGFQVAMAVARGCAEGVLFVQLHWCRMIRREYLIFLHKELCLIFRSNFWAFWSGSLAFVQDAFFRFHFFVPLDFAVKISQASLFFHRRFQGACVCAAFLWQLFTM